jgi:hypothetical protein
MPYRMVGPDDRKVHPLRMLFQPVGGGTFFKACEASDFRGLTAAILDDLAYEAAPVVDRLTERLRLAHDVTLLAELEGQKVQVADHDAPLTVNVATDEAFIQSLNRLGFVSLAPSLNPSASVARPEVWR